MKFENKRKTEVMAKRDNPFEMYIDYFFKGKKDKNPKLYVNKELDIETFEDGSDSVVLLGHSTALLKISGKIFITDPVLREGKVGPLGIVGPRNFKYKHDYSVDKLPKKIDGVLISHNHYDHLDIVTIKRLDKRVKKFFVPSGVKKILLSSGISEEKIVELDWYEKSSYENLEVIFTPTRHFSGRGIFDRNKTLWGSWVLKGDRTVFFSGDTGYCEEFKNIGEKYGPFDLTLIECGAYSKYWAPIHLTPEETVEVGKDLESKLIIPIHNRKYDLSFHRWDEPTIRFEKKAKKQGKLNYKIPNIGEIVGY